mmetsp:Transcript_28049/g.77184  ORF Transcript_28049/g.77184 Transcript_28049/m.77184 type:complete len:318 (-) Transcript_28049:355-1308(-)
MLVQEPAQPESVLEAAIAALTEEGDHRMASVANEHHLALHCPLRCPHGAEGAPGVLRHLPDQRLDPTDQGNRLRVVLLAEGGTALTALGRVREGLEGLLGALVVHVDGACEGAVPVGQRHEHVIAARPDVQAVPAAACLVATSAWCSKIVLPRVREEDLLVTPREDVLGEARVACPLQGVAHARACAVTGHNWAVDTHSQAAVLVRLGPRTLHEVQLAAHQAIAIEGGGLRELVLEMKLGALLDCQVDQKLVQVNPGDRIIALRVILAVTLEHNLAIWHVNDTTTDSGGQLSHDLVVQVPAQCLDGPEAAARNTQVD